MCAIGLAELGQHCLLNFVQINHFQVTFGLNASLNGLMTLVTEMLTHLATRSMCFVNL